ncbi:MAG: DUF2071 domain-containing protein [Planctomycetes bacterium]|nr:DUF2071 domain-containing protein [Planctomycetota bacterium]
MGTTLARTPFLQAHWSHLCILSYAVDPEVLKPDVPKGLQLDTRDGKAFISLVAFDFDDTLVKGIGVPGCRAFPEINLRFYVRRGTDRGVCFISELVPNRIVAWVAKQVYNEPYRRFPMTSHIKRLSDGMEVIHDINVDGHKYRIEVAATNEPPLLPESSSDAHWFKEQQFGFGRDKNGQTVMYEVKHPTWLTYHVTWHQLHFNFARVYGERWGFLSKIKPCSVVLAEGSNVEVYPMHAA